MPSIRACGSIGWCRRTEPMPAGVAQISMDPIYFLRSQHLELTAVRRDLHAHPELGFEEHLTAQVVTG